ncbi:RNA polymerase sigma factor [Bittarella massiliensis (ex Durand et al. 2017)]|uniref:RNA polymerase sigma factor n=1 Tax=Bittarella massiliensis (ex Durand et al. 2017) TaxID=1720313 RepID=UPI001AA1569E|nr:sigma-70 family RNA polymerase sigma factor [Bittarella massiliensis (ex Durand et al. 2017)]
MGERPLSHQQLAALLTRAQGGSEEAFAQLYRATYRAQWTQARLLLGSDALADEAVQESYIALYRNLQSISPPQVLVAYLNRTTFYVCQNLRRAETRHTRRSDGEERLAELPDLDRFAQPEERLADRERTERLAEGLAGLPARQRQALVLRYCQQLTIRQIAQVLGCSDSTVKRELRGGKAALHRLLGGVLPVFFPLGAALRASTAPPRRQLSRPAVGALAAGTAAVALGLAALPAPAIGEVRAEGQNGVARAVVSARGAKQVWLAAADGERYPLVEVAAGLYEGQPLPNGSYVAVAAGANGRQDRRELTVTQADERPPEIVESRGEGGLIALQLGDETGVDWAGCYLKGADGARIDPLCTQGETGYFDLSPGSYRVRVCDVLGNGGWSELTVSGQGDGG